MNPTATNWHEANQRYLTDALGDLRALLERHRDGHRRASVEVASGSSRRVDENVPPPALETIRTLFNLSSFERDLLLLCAGIELDSAFASLCAAAQGDAGRTYPTFSLALAALPDAHWSALAPTAPLRRWRLIEVGSGPALTLSPLRIDERVLHFLVGVQHLDERLAGIVEPVNAEHDPLPSHRELARQLVAVWTGGSGQARLPAIQLCGGEVSEKRIVAAVACRMMDLRLCTLQAHALPTVPGELEALIRLWERDAALSGWALMLECDGLEAQDTMRQSAIDRMIESLNGLLFIGSRERRRSQGRVLLGFDVRKPTTAEQRSMWQQVLGEHAIGLNGTVGQLVSQFDLGVGKIDAVSSEMQSMFKGERKPEEDAEGLPANSSGNRAFEDALWDACRAQSRSSLDDLAQRIESHAEWSDLVLPDAQLQTLSDIEAQVRHRAKVYETWGFAAKSSRGLGITTLFAGSSGTGKTMAAEVLANRLRLDLYRIDLSQVVSKYIGETEKNLRRVFDAAEEGGAVLLFDEADALFGKRSEVKDSHDRYANIEVSYLLQRMEAYRGLAILTTNMRSALDTAFLRRLRFVIEFPFPDLGSRAEIWRRIFPSDTPTDGLDLSKLARLNVAGGNISNIALNAAFIAAGSDEPVRMEHLLRAARSEYMKLEKPLTEAEIGGWI